MVGSGSAAGWGDGGLRTCADVRAVRPTPPPAEALDRGVRGAGVGRCCGRPNAEAVGIEMRRLVARSAKEAT